MECRTCYDSSFGKHGRGKRITAKPEEGGIMLPRRASLSDGEAGAYLNHGDMRRIWMWELPAGRQRVEVHEQEP